MMASEDFSKYGEIAPAAFFILGAKGSGAGHSPTLMIDDTVLPTGAAVYAQAAVDILNRLSSGR